jgi:hypothetical protein
MRILTLTQPFATLVAAQDWNWCKRLETRSWATSYRGPLAIHASQGLGYFKSYAAYRAFCGAPMVARALARAGVSLVAQMPMGKIVAVCELVGCVQIGEASARASVASDDGERSYVIPPYPDTPEWHYGDYSPGRYAWMLGAVRPLREPLPYRGAQGLRPLPADVITLVEALTVSSGPAAR